VRLQPEVALCFMERETLFSNAVGTHTTQNPRHTSYPRTDKSLARPGRKQARQHVRDARDFNNIETRAVIKFVFLQGKASNEIHVLLTEILACFLPGRAKDFSAPLHFKLDSNPTPHTLSFPNPTLLPTLHNLFTESANLLNGI